MNKKEPWLWYSNKIHWNKIYGKVTVYVGSGIKVKLCFHPRPVGYKMQNKIGRIVVPHDFVDHYIVEPEPDFFAGAVSIG